jgi:hypothetical protein
MRPRSAPDAAKTTATPTTASHKARCPRMPMKKLLNQPGVDLTRICPMESGGKANVGRTVCTIADRNVARTVADRPATTPGDKVSFRPIMTPSKHPPHYRFLKIDQGGIAVRGVRKCFGKNLE